MMKICVLSHMYLSRTFFLSWFFKSVLGAKFVDDKSKLLRKDYGFWRSGIFLEQHGIVYDDAVLRLCLSKVISRGGFT